MIINDPIAIAFFNKIGSFEGNYFIIKTYSLVRQYHPHKAHPA